MTFKPNCLATAIGSLPHEDPEKAVDLVLACIPDAPAWPQLPALGLREQMDVQYSEGMPRALIDDAKRRIYFDTRGDYSEPLAGFYEVYLAAMDPGSGSGDCSALAISPAFSRGLYALERRLKQAGPGAAKRPFVKCQTAGPCSFALTVVDENKRAMYYNEEFRDMIVKALAMKCRWQIQRFQPFAERVICFIDEPILSAFGSSTYVSVQRPDVVGLIGELVEAIHRDRALAGVHCCGNTEWSIPIDAGVDIVNFHAFEFGESIALYPGQVKALLERGGALAWGVVPTSPAVREQTVDSLVGRLEAAVDNLAAKSGLDRKLILAQSMITPACGAGLMKVQDAERVFALLADTAEAIKAKHGV